MNDPLPTFPLSRVPLAFLAFALGCVVTSGGIYGDGGATRDAGPSTTGDAGRDAGPVPTDGGPSPRDAGVDAGRDAGVDAGRDAGRRDAGCIPRGDETCNGFDDDCDGRTDEDFDFSSNAAHCGGCGNACPESTICDTGVCKVVCPVGFADCDNDGTCEADLSSDATCGSCASGCGITEQCVSGTCQNECVSCGMSEACTTGCCDYSDVLCDSTMAGESCGARDTRCFGCDCNVGCAGADGCYLDCGHANMAYATNGCTIDARDVRDAAFDCWDATNCEIDCRGVSERCDLDCADDAECVLYCDPGVSSDRCRIDDCHDMVRDCGGGVFTCGRACPSTLPFAP